MNELFVGSKSIGTAEFVEEVSNLGNFIDDLSFLSKDREYIDKKLSEIKPIKGDAGIPGENAEIIKEDIDPEKFLQLWDGLPKDAMALMRGKRGLSGKAGRDGLNGTDGIDAPLQNALFDTQLQELLTLDKFIELLNKLDKNQLKKIRGLKGEKGRVGKGLAGGPGVPGPQGEKGDQGSSGEGSSINDLPCDSGVSVRDIVYVDADNHVEKAKSDAISTSKAIGFVVNKPTATTCDIQVAGEVDGFTGLSFGEVYFLSESTAGGMALSVPATGSSIVLGVAIAISSTKIKIDLHAPSLMQRAA